MVVYDERVMPDGPGMAQVLEMFEALRRALRAKSLVASARAGSPKTSSACKAFMDLLTARTLQRSHLSRCIGK